MERVNQLKAVVKNVLTRLIDEGQARGELLYPIFDDENGRYQLMSHGWRGENRFFGILLHLEVHDDKIWIEQDGIETGIANELLAYGLEKSDIVLGFHSPYMRQFMDYAVG